MSKDYEAPICPFCQGEMWPVVVVDDLKVRETRTPYWECFCIEFPDDIEVDEL